MATNTTKISQLSQLTSLTDSITWPVVSDGATRRVALSTVRDEIIKPANSTRLGGIKVGNNLSVAPDGTLSATYSYSLPIASDSRLGGVKVGLGLTISPTGTLSTTYELPPATYSTLGGIKVGDNLTIAEDGTLNAQTAQELDGASVTTSSPGILEVLGQSILISVPPSLTPEQTTNSIQLSAGEYGVSAIDLIGTSIDGYVNITASANLGSETPGTNMLGITPHYTASQKPFINPSFSSVDRDSLTIKAPGMIIFNTTTSKFQGYTGSAWVDLH